MRAIRKLAAASLGFSASVFLAHYVLPFKWLLPFAAICALAAIAGIFVHNNTGRRVLIIGLALACGFSLYHINYKRVISPCEEIIDEKLTVTARITSYPDYRSGCYLQNVRFTDAKLPNVDGLIIDYENEDSKLIPGDVISVTLKLNPSNQRYDSEYDANISKGLYVVGTVFGEVQKTGHEKSLLYFPQYIGNAIREKIEVIFPDTAAFFFKALLTGDKSEYYAEHEDFSCAMSIAGLSHVVAVSGMHVAFLVGFLQLILGKSRKCSLLCLALVWIFVIMVGAPASAVRAGFMQSLLLLAPIFKRENDAITSLSFALAVILLANPFACGNIGLQLSFGAMAGIVLFGDRIYKWLRKNIQTENSLVCYLLAITASSVAVSVFTFPLCALHFGYISILSILANILCLWAISILFCGGYLAVALGAFVPAVAKPIAFVLSYLVQYVALVVKCIAKLPHAALYTENTQIICWLILTYAIFFICAFYKKNKLRPLVPLAISLASLVCILGITHFSMLSSKGTVAVMDVGNGQCIALTEGKTAVVVDCGSAGTLNNAGSEMTSFLRSHGRNSIDALLLTHLHSDHAKGVVRLLNTVDVKTIIMPATAMDTAEDGLYEKIVHAAQENNVEILLIDSAEKLCYGGIELNIYTPSEKGDENERCLTLTASVSDYNVLITGDAGKSVEAELAENEDLSDTDLLIVGHHGSKHSCSQELLQAAKPGAAVISVGYNSYGHPTNAVVQRLAAYGVTIYRTDLMGRIIITTA